MNPSPTYPIKENDMSDRQPVCELCGEPMPAGETMFKYHGYSGPCPKPPLSVPKNEVRRFDAESWVCVHCRQNSDVVQVTSNIADEATAELYATAIKESGGFVFRICKAGVLVAALQLIVSRNQ